MADEQKAISAEQLAQFKKLNAEIAGLYTYLGQITTQWELLKNDTMIKLKDKEDVIEQMKGVAMKEFDLDPEQRWTIDWKTGAITKAE